MKITEEQQQIVNSRGGIIQVNAFAGTGKTSTLVEYARRYPRERFLYLAFNKAVANEAVERFPENVLVKTAHSLAYGQYGKHFAHKLSTPRLQQFLDALCPGETSLQDILFAQRVLLSLNDWMHSASTEILATDIELPEVEIEMGMSRPEVALAMTGIWKKMQDVRDTFPMPHDGYLKLMQISGKLPGWVKADTILFDEAQDADPAMLDLVVAQDGKRKIFVGDVHQAIYGFRGAINAMQHIAADENLALTGSFRFGEELADVANCILSVKDVYAGIRGLGKPTEVMRYNDMQLGADVGYRPGTALITRGNSAAVAKAYEIANAGKRVHFIGGPDAYKLRFFEDVASMYDGRPVRDKFLSAFKNFAELEEFSNKTDDVDIRTAVTFVIGNKKAGRNVKEVIDSVRRAHIDSRDEADLVLSTAHKAKGLEFNRLHVGDDFPTQFFDKDGSREWINPKSGEVVMPVTDEDINLLYVASTRGKQFAAVPNGLVEQLPRLRARASRINMSDESIAPASGSRKVSAL